MKISGSTVLAVPRDRAYAMMQDPEILARAMPGCESLEPIGPDEVHGTAALVLHVAKTGGGGTYVDLVGEYEDEYVRDGGRWRFRRRRLVPI